MSSSFVANHHVSNFHYNPLMHNQSMVVDPTYPTLDEYNQSNYLPTEFFNNPHQPQHPYDNYFRQSPHHMENPYMSQSIGPNLTTHPAANYGNYPPPPPTNNAYQLPHHVVQHQHQHHHHHHQQQHPIPPQPDLHELSTGLHNMSLPPENAQQAPPSATALLHPAAVPNQPQHMSGPQNGGVMMVQSSNSPSVSPPCHLQSPPLSSQHVKDLHSHSGDGSSDEIEDLEDDDYSHTGSTDQGSPNASNDGNGSPDTKISPIFPWMKKGQTAGYGEWQFKSLLESWIRTLYAGGKAKNLYNLNRDVTILLLLWVDHRLGQLTLLEKNTYPKIFCSLPS